MARPLSMLLALLALVALCEGATLVVNSPTDTSAPGSTCGATCNFRTAWALAKDGDTILVTVDSIMDNTIDSCPFTGNLTVVGKSSAHGGRPYISGKSTTSHFINCRLNGMVDLLFDNLAIQSFNGTETIDLTGSLFTGREGNLAHLAAHKKGLHAPKTTVGKRASGGSTVTFYKCSFLSNTMRSWAALSVWDLYELNVVQCDFEDNQSGNNFGSAVFSWSSININIHQSQFVRNLGSSAVVGGNAKNLKISDCTFQNNRASSGIVFNQGPVAISGTSFEANHGTHLIYTEGSVNASSVVGEVSEDNYVVYTYSSLNTSTTLALSDCTFYSLNGEDVNLINQPVKIFNQNPGNSKIATGTGMGVFQSCGAVGSGPLPCYATATCQGVNNGQGQEIGYNCQVPNHPSSS